MVSRSFDERLFSQGMAWHQKALRITPDGLYCSKASQETYLLMRSCYRLIDHLGPPGAVSRDVKEDAWQNL